jgi:hypothetical protein
MKCETNPELFEYLNNSKRENIKPWPAGLASAHGTAAAC